MLCATRWAELESSTAITHISRCLVHPRLRLSDRVTSGNGRPTHQPAIVAAQHISSTQRHFKHPRPSVRVLDSCWFMLLPHLAPVHTGTVMEHLQSNQ